VGALKRRTLLQAAALAGALPVAAQGGSKVLRVAFAGSEAGFDPVQLSDAVSTAIVSSLFDAPLAYAHLARPAALVPNTAVALPEVSENHQRFIFTLRPGTLFGDHPAFGGQARELVAADYVYSLKRYWDPAHPSPVLFHYQNAGLLGLAALRARARETGRFDYDTEVAGLRALDRYRFEVCTDRPVPRLPWVFASPALAGAVAREVIEAEPGRSMSVPVGTGPYRVAAWTRSSRIVLERNPAHRRRPFDETAAPGDAAGEAIAARLRGQPMPLIDRVEIAIIQEAQPRWLAFLNGEHDFLDRLPNEFAPNAIPHNKLAPNLAKQGIQMVRTPLVDATFSYFGMENPVVGGYTPERVAFRRAMGMAYDVQGEIERVRLGQAIPAQSLIPPLLSGYDPAFKTEMSEYSVPKARALLDLYGWVDKDGDGWRDQPDGSPLLLEYSSQPDQQSRKLQELWRKAAESVNVRITFKISKWPEQLKASRAGKLMMWGVAWGGVSPDGAYFLDLLYGPNKGQANHARFDLPEFNRLYEQQNVMPDGPEREALIRRMKLLSVAYAPYKVTGHRVATDLMHSAVVGYRRHPFLRDFFRYVDVDPSRQP
jgi:ABC-type transport system substrate-binding protein